MLEVANLLKQSKDEVGKHVLFLGSDIPLKPRGETLEVLLAEAAEAVCAERAPGFAELAEAQKAVEVRRVLGGVELTEKARQRAAAVALRDLQMSEGWIWLAQLTKVGYFSLILTFSVHDLLERALEIEKMAPGEDYNLVVAGLDDREIVSGAVHKSARITVVKLGGDIRRGLVPLLPEEVAGNVRHVDGIVHSVSSRALLMVAHSPVEAEVVRYMSRSGGPVYWVSPKAPVEERERFVEMKIGDPSGIRVHALSPQVASFLSQRGSKERLLAREKGEFDTFFASLQNRLLRRGLDTQIAYIKRKTLISAPDRPFKFLQAFDQKDATIFFGREQEVRELLEMMAGTRLLVLLGRSGVGKTSLIRAGLMPALEEKGWLSIVTRPLGDAAAAIKARVMDWLEAGQAGELDSLQEAPLSAFLTRAVQMSESKVTLFMDQFEEAFTKLPDETRSEMVEALAGCLAEPGLAVNVVLCLREDHFADLCDLRTALPTVFEHVYRVKKLSRAAATLAMTKPPEKFRVTVEPSLVERILNDLDSEGIDPSGLELVMYALHSSLPVTERVLSARLYRSLGGTAAVLGDCVENALKRLAWRERPLARRVLKELVLNQDQRALVSEAKIAQDLDLKAEAISTVLWDLEDAGLVRRVEGEKPDGEYELVHDFLALHVGHWLTEKEARGKETQAMLQRELRGFRVRGALLSPDKMRLLNEQRDSLSLDNEELSLIVASSLDIGADISHWMERVSRLNEGWEQLLPDALRRGNEAQRAAAVRLLERLGDASLVESVLASLPASLGAERSALNALLTRGERGLVSEVRKGRTEERKRAISALGRIGTPKAAAPLIRALEDPDSEVRRAASQAIEEMGGERIADMMVHRLLSAADSARWEIADTLVNLAAKVGTIPILRALGTTEVAEGAWGVDDSAPAAAPLGTGMPAAPEGLARDYVLGRILTRRRQISAAREVLSRAQKRCQSASEVSLFSEALAEADQIEGQLEKGYYAWTMFRKDPCHSGLTPEKVVPPLSLGWSFRTEDQFVSSPVVYRAAVYCPSHNGQVYALDVNSGGLLWQQKFTSHVDSSPAIDGDSLFLGTNEGQLLSLEVASGKTQWRFKAGGEVRSSPVIDGGLVFFGCWDGCVYAVEGNSGEQVWRTETGGEIYSSAAVCQGRIVVGNWLGQVVALEASKGNMAWRFSTSEEVYCSPAIEGGSVFIGSDDGYLYCLSLDDGWQRWRTFLGSRIRSSPAIVGDRVIVGSSDGHLYCLSRDSGQELWQVETRDEIRSSPAVSGQVVFFCSRDGSLAAVDLQSGEVLWKHSTAFGILSSPAVAEGRVIVGMDYSEICAFHSQASGATEGERAADPGVDKRKT